MVDPKDQLRRCIVCSRRESVLRMRQIEVCFDCALDVIEPIDSTHTLIIELKLNNEPNVIEESHIDSMLEDYRVLCEQDNPPNQLEMVLGVENEAW